MAAGKSNIKLFATIGFVVLIAGVVVFIIYKTEHKKDDTATGTDTAPPPVDNSKILASLKQQQATIADKMKSAKGKDIVMYASLLQQVNQKIQNLS